MLFGSVPLMSVKEFLLEGFWQNSLAWLTVILFLAVPIISMITWLVRRIMGVRSKNHYLGYVFGSLWFIGIMSAALLTGSIIRSFKSRSFVEENVALTQPSTGKLFLDVTTQNYNYHYYSNDWGFDWDNEWPLFGANLDSIMLNIVRIDVVKSLDDNFHISKVRFSRGKDPIVAINIAAKINFPISQNDSIVYLPKGFSISKNERWRNQQVLLVLQVPVGKRFMLDKNASRYDHFDVHYNHRGSIDISDTWERTYWVEDGKEYIMTPEGPKKINDLDPEALLRGEYRERKKDLEDSVKERAEDEIKRKKQREEDVRERMNSDKDANRGGGYRYQRKTKENKKDTASSQGQSI
jgi:hypothetical protein